MILPDDERPMLVVPARDYVGSVVVEAVLPGPVTLLVFLPLDLLAGRELPRFRLDRQGQVRR